ncbi:MAG: hypothetical protein HFH47_03455 [Bacilli bacterium]|nr:hypothetical protein [Bacilli bacterium]
MDKRRMLISAGVLSSLVALGFVYKYVKNNTNMLNEDDVMYAFINE